MSSILKALKKLENDNATCKPGQIRIDSKILQERSVPGLSRFTVCLLVIVFVAVGSGTTYVFMKKQEGSAAIQTRSNAPPRPAALTQAPVGTDIQQRKQKQRPTLPKIITRPEEPISSHRIPATSLTTVTQPEKQVAPLQPIEMPQQPNVQNTPVAVIVRPVLTVNGIAFQEGSGDNLAVINGTTVTKGSVIEGVKVEEIQNDRVRFSQKGERFEIILNKSNR
jgi:hypothetical protein